jgi:hypothetical protein
MGELWHLCQAMAFAAQNSQLLLTEVLSARVIYFELFAFAGAGV